MGEHRLAILGYGGFGQFLHHAWKGIPGLVLVAVSGRRRSPRIPPGVPYYPDWRELIEREQPEIVAIATPPVTHAPIARYAMERGCHVIVEKPLATTLEDAQELVALRDRRGVRATVDFTLRYSPIVEALARITQEGILGRLMRVVIENYASGELPREHWFWDWEQSGGILVEHGVHFFDLVHFLLGDPTVRSVSGVAYRRGDGLVDRMAALVLHPEGVVASHFHAFSRPGFLERTSLRLAYDLGEVEVEGWIPLSGTVRALVNERTKGYLELLPGLEVIQEVPVEKLGDVSRPEGWGDEWPLPPPPGREVRSGGRTYYVETFVEARFSLSLSKAEAYTACLRSLMEEFLAWIEDPARRPRVSLEDGLRALEVALAATRSP